MQPVLFDPLSLLDFTLRALTICQNFRASQTSQVINGMYLFEDLFLQVHQNDEFCLRIEGSGRTVRKNNRILFTNQASSDKW